MQTATSTVYALSLDEVGKPRVCINRLELSDRLQKIELPQLTSLIESYFITNSSQTYLITLRVDPRNKHN